MDDRFIHHNAHLESPSEFAQRDPQLRHLARLPLVHHWRLARRLPREVPGIYSITGGRQVGKTTLLKQWMAELLSEGVEPQRIAFFTGELIDDHHALTRILRTELEAMPTGLRFLLIDEVTYVSGWDRATKFLADAGLLQDTILVATGSDTILIREARMRLPGRRGRAAEVDFVVRPLSFAETVALKGRVDIEEVRAAQGAPPPSVIDILVDAFEEFLEHGGYLTAINDVAATGSISQATLATYADWIRGDMLKRRKQEGYLREVLTAILKRQGSQVTWNALAKDLSIDHPATVSDYVELLARMDAVFIQPALLEDKLVAAPKKARKVAFADPFIFHSVRSWLTPVANPHFAQIRAAVRDPELAGRLAEACAASHYRRSYPTYYIKAEGEVDVAIVTESGFVPIEVKWTGQLRPKDLKQIQKYPNGQILTRSREPGAVHGIPSEPLPLALLRLG